MFNHKDKPQSVANGQTHLDSLIGQGTVVKGDVHFTGVLHIDGTVEGALVATGSDDVITISENGHIIGRIQVANVVINGQVEGDIEASGKIEVASRARINGNIYYKNIEMETGAQINGQLIYQGQTEQQIRAVEDLDKKSKNNKSSA
jgi:cytoskeletal protein CcmA (bactofilin family)